MEFGFGFCSARVRQPTVQDKDKLEKMLGFLSHARDDVLTLEADDLSTLHWHVDARFAVHPDMKSHAGATFTLGNGRIISISSKQKISTKSSTEAELAAVDNALPLAL